MERMSRAGLKDWIRMIEILLMKRSHRSLIGMHVVLTVPAYRRLEPQVLQDNGVRLLH